MAHFLPQPPTSQNQPLTVELIETPAFTDRFIEIVPQFSLFIYVLFLLFFYGSFDIAPQCLFFWCLNVLFWCFVCVLRLCFRVAFFYHHGKVKGTEYEQIQSKLTEDKTLRYRTNVFIDDNIKLLRFTLSNNYFTYKDRTYKQIHSCALGSPVSRIVKTICMDEIDVLAINKSPMPSRIWKRYGDDGPPYHHKEYSGDFSRRLQFSRSVRLLKRQDLLKMSQKSYIASSTRK